MIQFDSHLLDRSKKYYLGFSGGPDSLAAAHFLSRGGWNIELLHVQHFNTRASIDILNGCRSAAEALKLPFSCFGGFFYAEDRDDLSEAAAHEIRSKIIADRAVPTILCNHLNDLAEGYWMNCQAGYPNRVPLVARNGNKVRPFLRTKKVDFLSYLNHHGLTPLIVPDSMLSFRETLRQQVWPAIGQDWTGAARKLFVDTDLIYKEY